MLTQVPFGRVSDPASGKSGRLQGRLVGDRGEVFPSTLFKYYSLDGIEKTISTNGNFHAMRMTPLRHLQWVGIRNRLG